MLFTAATQAAGTTFDCTVSPSSTFSQTTDLVLPLAGTWIGNWDAIANDWTISQLERQRERDAAARNRDRRSIPA